MTFYTILALKEILCCFSLVLHGKTSKGKTKSSRLEFLENFLANNFALSDTEDNISGSRNRGGMNTSSNSPKVLRAKILGSNGLFCCSSICKFDSFKNPFAKIISLSQLSLDSEDLFWWSKRKK